MTNFNIILLLHFLEKQFFNFLYLFLTSHLPCSLKFTGVMLSCSKLQRNHCRQGQPWPSQNQVQLSIFSSHLTQPLSGIVPGAHSLIFETSLFGFQDSASSWFSLYFTGHSLEYSPVPDFYRLEQEVCPSLDSSSLSILSFLMVSYNLVSMNTYKLTTLRFMFQLNLFP